MVGILISSIYSPKRIWADWQRKKGLLSNFSHSKRYKDSYVRARGRSREHCSFLSLHRDTSSIHMMAIMHSESYGGIWACKPAELHVILSRAVLRQLLLAVREIGGCCIQDTLHIVFRSLIRFPPCCRCAIRVRADVLHQY